MSPNENWWSMCECVRHHALLSVLMSFFNTIIRGCRSDTVDKINIGLNVVFIYMNQSIGTFTFLYLKMFCF